MRKTAATLKTLVPAVLLVIGLLAANSEASAQTRALKLYNVHTNEKQTIVFKRGGRYDSSGLKKINHILRDWRKNQPTKMDPRLLDLIWEVYQKSGSRDYIHVICGYRSPGTNAMLKGRSRRSGVAEKSQHMLGKALDFYIPDVRLSKLREIGVKFQVGGVGFYPKSGSPFVHMDIGGVRAWPRMPRRELSRLFPDGKTIHRPAEGGQMPGYSAALKDYKRRVGSNSIMIAGDPSKNSDSETKQGKSLLAALFSRADEDEGDMNDAPETAVEKPSKKVKEEPKEEILTASAEDEKIAAPVPRVRPAFAEEETETLQTALLSTKKNAAEDAMKAALTPQIEALETASKEGESEEDETSEFSNLAEYKIPVPELLGERKRPGDGEEVLTASAETLDGATMAALGGVPVPAFRPEDGQKLVTAAADDLNAPAPDLKAEEVAALARETGEKLNADARTDEDEVAGMIDSLDGADKTNADANLAEMASLDMPKTTVTRGFAIPASLPEDEVAVTPKAATKGHRLTREEAKADANDSTRIEPKLTQNLIAQWALTKGRAEVLAKPVKAPRFVSRTMRKQPTAVYADGFSLSSADVNPDRFSGTAVNFMPVKKFEN
ncbi:DUF882 domain-containing protein [Rhizobium sp. TH2]|uniref:DUF882 domain-containing protein n=1 Tax=Rhizobium sp. TH2 TaxID=2775403 RepID=UPI002158529C|nr:DUF882 domain-containing protein [Rhizobium sp. TH2]UVC07670.1 DUF882 domain-containing protein [Rhizobium sp. TH2]